MPATGSSADSSPSVAQENAAAPVMLPHAIQSNLPVPSRLDTRGNIAENWKRWKQVWGSFEIASRLNQQENQVRVATFITCIGSDALEVYNSLPFENDEDKMIMSKVLELMEKHCIGQTNVIYERYCFNNRNQEFGESFDAYLTALKALAKTCNFGSLKDELIPDRSVCGIRDTGTRKKLLQEAGLTLQRCNDTCRSAETTATQVKAMSGKEDVNELSQRIKQGSRGKNKSRPKFVECKYCGRKHERSRGKCVAFEKESTKCGKANHLAKVCRQENPSPKSERKERIHQFGTSPESQDSSDEEYCFTLTLEGSEEYVNNLDSSSFKSKIFATMKVGSQPVRFQVDSGATCNVISKNILPKEWSKTVQQMKLVEVHDYENIASVQKETEARGLTMDQISTQFHDVFNGEGRLEKKLHLEIDDVIEPVRQPVRRIPVAMKPRLKEELARLRKIGVIKPVDTPTDWVSSLVVVKKPNGKLVKGQGFQVYDVKNGFWHVELDEASSYLTTFGTPFGRYRWLKLPFGISPAPEYFQHRLDQSIEGLPGVRTVAGDILITGEGDTLQEAVKDHDKNLLALLARCREKGVKLNKEKFKLRMSEVPYVGHLLTKDGLKPAPSKIEAIQKMSRPSDVKGVQRIDTERNYAQIEKELLAIVFGAEKFNQYTYGRKVFVESDHKPLEVIYQKPLVAAPNRLQRMLLRLQKYDLEIYFKPGQHMYLADTLSRALLSRDDKVLSIQKEIEEIRMVDFLPIHSASLENIRRESLKDSSIQAL
ncbi:PREDICTED: uncharacterized protein LOC107338702 [Acropora digitifera]|uniref:uncharacterized protein LOC107338702 n=1 Tax=Acropora digitifera TaxID=70779 RepID=UPI00077ABC63|nr:PREDICTED: uncharacterized protein LOC107338702 [Acropora digitifera]